MTAVSPHPCCSALPTRLTTTFEPALVGVHPYRFDRGRDAQHGSTRRPAAARRAARAPGRRRRPARAPCAARWPWSARGSAPGVCTVRYRVTPQSAHSVIEAVRCGYRSVCCRRGSRAPGRPRTPLRPAGAEPPGGSLGRPRRAARKLGPPRSPRPAGSLHTGADHRRDTTRRPDCCGWWIAVGAPTHRAAARGRSRTSSRWWS